MIFVDVIKTRFRKILSIDEPPHRTSLAFAIGIFIAFSPTIGLHTISAVATAWLFGLNLPVIMAGTLVNNPWTIIFVYGTSTCFGSFILRNGSSCLPDGTGKEELLDFMMAMPVPFITGTIILGIVSALISYFFLYQVLTVSRSQRNKSPS